jgi:hypothetical protein
MNHQHFDEQLIESAWQQVELEIRASGMVAPAPGFANRWQERLAKHRVRAERKQTWLILILSTVIAFGFLFLTGIQFIPSLPSVDGIFAVWVDFFAKVVVFIKMVVGILETLFRTLPRVIPPSWWISIISSFVVLVVLWTSMMKRHVQRQGV